MRVYLVGQNNFGNRGCEALVRSTVQILRARDAAFSARVPSLLPQLDAGQWPDAARDGAEFVPAPRVPPAFVNWERALRRLPVLRRLKWPRFVPTEETLREIEACDGVLSIGGDNYSLDYDLASLFLFVGIAETALRMGKPVVLWGASVGPFTAQPSVERAMADHLKRLTLITVRESLSRAYLASIGVTANVMATSDSAFVMKEEALDVAPFWPKHGSRGTLGFNLSPLVHKIRAKAGTGEQLIAEATRFLRRATADGWSVLLVPHVTPLDYQARNNDHAFLGALMEACGDAGQAISLAPKTLNAPQLKHVISRCRFFIGARTHATIAALSSGVPTISIAYSVKASGINRDLFDHERYVLDSAAVSSESLSHALELLVSEEAAIRSLLADRMPEYRARLDDCGARVVSAFRAEAKVA